jgi:phosphohistidine phosphatase SixA
MKIYLLRSSMAGPVDAPDAHRYLSAEGRQVLRAIGSKIRLTEEPCFDRVISSPLPAVVQTAELFAERTDYVGVIETLPLLTPETPPSVIAPLVLERGEAVLVVGDEPVLSVLGAFLVGRPTFPQLVHAQVSVIEDRKPAWCLRPGDLARQLLLVA